MNESAPTATPAALGYRWRAEWEPHAATWLAWPHQREDWPGKFGPVPWLYVEIVRLLSRFEPVQILVPSRRIERTAADRLDRAGVDLQHVQFHRVPTDRSWTRDFVPTFLVRDGAEPSVGAVDWRFNGWAKYANHRADNRAGRKIAETLGIPRWKPMFEHDGKPVRVVLEGGALDGNGHGTMLTTEECLLSTEQERNPGLDRAGYERVFAEYLGIRHTIWLGRGIAGDDTHGHVDDLARFVDKHTVVTVVERDRADANFEPLQDDLRRLQSAKDADGQPLRIFTLPMPRPVIFRGQRLPASYANFYVANGLVLVPTFHDPADREALQVMAELFPGREVVGVHAVDLVWGLGTLHCLSHEQPAAAYNGGGGQDTLRG